jgi:hypothetical protein
MLVILRQWAWRLIKATVMTFKPKTTEASSCSLTAIYCQEKMYRILHPYFPLYQQVDGCVSETRQLPLQHVSAAPLPGYWMQFESHTDHSLQPCVLHSYIQLCLKVWHTNTKCSPSTFSTIQKTKTGTLTTSHDRPCSSLSQYSHNCDAVNVA